jgi:hypothetical protein
VAVYVHVLEQAAQVGAGDVGLQGPRRVGVADYPSQVGNLLQKHTFIGHLVAQLARLAVHRQFHSTQHLQVDARRRDDDVGFQFPPGLQQDALLGEGVDLIGDHRRLTGFQHLEQIAIRHQAQPLVPRHIPRGEVAHVHGRVEVASNLPEQQSAHLCGPATARQVEVTLEGDLALARQLPNPLRWQESSEKFGDLVEGGQRGDVRRRALQHGDVLRVARHRRNQGDRRCATADYDDLLAGVVQVFRPLLRVDAPTLELVHTGKGR